MKEKKENFSDKLEIIKDTLEKPVFSENQLGIYRSGYINNLDEVLEVLEDKNEEGRNSK